MIYRQLISLCFIALFYSVNVFALTTNEIQEVRKQFAKARVSEDACEAIYDRLQAMLEQKPDEPLLLAYFGSTETLMGKYAWMPWNKMGYVEDGIGHIERALRLSAQQKTAVAVPSTADEVRLVAASTYVSLPDMFNTFDSGRKLLTRLLEQDARSDWPNDFRYSLYVAAVTSANRNEDKEAEVKWQARVDALSTNITTGVTQP